MPHIAEYSRIDTVSWPGRYLSTIRVGSSDEGGESITEIANVIRSDRESLDGLLIIGEDGDPERMPGIHRLISAIRPPGLQVILVTRGGDTAAIDDLVGAGYVDRVGFILDGPPDKDQRRSIDVVAADGAVYDIVVILDPRRMNNDRILDIAASVDGYDSFILLALEDIPPYGKRDLNALAKALKGRARNVRVNSGRFRKRQERAPRRGSASGCSG